MRIFCHLGFAALLIASSAAAEEIWLLGCDGSLKTAAHITGAEGKSLVLTVSEANLHSVVLRAVDTAVEVKGTVTGNRVSFRGLKKGSYRICTEQGSLVEFSEASLIDESGTSIQELALGGATAAVAAAGLAVGGGSAGGTPNADAGTQLMGSNDETIPASSTNNPATSAASAGSSSRGDCFVGDEVKPLSPFL